MRITAPLLRGDGQLHIVGAHDVVTLDDPDGAIHRLVTLADGSRSTSELFSALAPDFPRLDPRDVVEAVAELEAAGFAECCAPRQRLRREPALLR